MHKEAVGRVPYRVGAKRRDAPGGSQSYLRQLLLQLTAGIAVLYHQNQGQEVRGGQRAGITAVEEEDVGVIYKHLSSQPEAECFENVVSTNALSALTADDRVEGEAMHFLTE